MINISAKYEFFLILKFCDVPPYNQEISRNEN